MTSIRLEWFKMMNTNEIQLFTNEVFGSVRATVINGDVWMVGKDVATALGYSNSKQAIIDHCREDGVVISDLIDSLGRTQQAKYINERNVIRLIMRSHLPQAEEFQDWVEDEIIPSVLKNGSYSIKQDSYLIEDPIERAKAWIQEQEEKRALELVNKEQQEVIEKQEHKINEQNDSIRNLLDISDLPYETIRQRIFEFMRPRHTAYGSLYAEFDLRYGVRSGVKFRNYKEKFLERYDLGEVKKKEMIKSQLAYICDEMEMAEELYLVMEDIFHDDFLQFLRSKIDDLTFTEVA